MDLLVEMNLRLCIICIAALLALGTPALAEVPFLADSNITATVHGAAYAWDTLETINNTVIDVNSTPPQSIVAKDGTYSFELMPGDYTITASYYQNDTLIYSKETTLKIEDEGSYVLDLLLYPVSESRVTETIATRKNQNGMSSTGQTRTGSLIRGYLPIILTIFFLLGGSYQLSKKHKKIKEKKAQERKLSISGLLVKALNKIAYSGVKSESRNSGKSAFISEPILEPGDNSENTASLKKQPIPPELSETLNIIRGNKGRITQKDLRGRLKYSEVKVSLLLSELEKRRLIKKFKNGRENIVVLIDEEP